jgi:hypothetical protein
VGFAHVDQHRTAQLPLACLPGSDFFNGHAPIIADGAGQADGDRIRAMREPFPAADERIGTAPGPASPDGESICPVREPVPAGKEQVFPMREPLPPEGQTFSLVREPIPLDGKPVCLAHEPPPLDDAGRSGSWASDSGQVTREFRSCAGLFFLDDKRISLGAGSFPPDGEQILPVSEPFRLDDERLSIVREPFPADMPASPGAPRALLPINRR